MVVLHILVGFHEMSGMNKDARLKQHCILIIGFAVAVQSELRVI